MSIGGGSDKSSGKSQSSGSTWDYGTNVWGPQSPYLTNLFGQAQNTMAANPVSEPAYQYMAKASDALGGVNQAVTGANEQLMKFMNPGQDPALAAYATNLGQQFNEQFMPGLKGDAALAGGLGGSRQQIGAALGAQRAMQTLGDFTAQTYAGQQERALQAALGMGQNATTLQGGAETNLALADFARSMPWYSLGQYAGLLGSPIMQDLGAYSTNQSSTKQSSSGFRFNAGLGGG